jgi:hypothetical protein
MLDSYKKTINLMLYIIFFKSRFIVHVDLHFLNTPFKKMMYYKNKETNPGWRKLKKIKIIKLNLFLFL